MNWIKIEDREPKEGQLVLVKGDKYTELASEFEYGIGLVEWISKENSPAKDYCYYAIDYSDIKEWCEVE